MSATATANPTLSPSGVVGAAAAVNRRITSIDALRGLVMCIMMMDHVRENLFLHYSLTDPLTLADTPVATYFSRIAAHFCAPIFVFLTGLGAWLYANPPGGTPRSAREFLLKRGALLIFLELTIISFIWTASLPKVIYLQVIWAIGISMIVLAFASALSRKVLLAIGLVIVCGHNALAFIDLPREHALYEVWTLTLHRGWLFEDTMPQVRVTYPFLPWIGVIFLGWCAGPMFARDFGQARRRRLLVILGVACWIAFAILRGFNIYGENAPWVPQATTLLTVMDIFNVTKYPPSLAFLLMTLGGGFFILAWIDTADNGFIRFMSHVGGAPMFYYIVHLAILITLYRFCEWAFGPNQVGPTGLVRFGVSAENYWVVWVATVAMCLLMYYPTRWFGEYKRRTTRAWVKYF